MYTSLEHFLKEKMVEVVDHMKEMSICLEKMSNVLSDINDRQEKMEKRERLKNQRRY